ncbi:MAG: ComEC/Rec2 family competence protein [candidate division KSB1 bacterium]|nr:ComEC/Rec2 family competence protein [candidate division KSB1 bacterium]
MPKGDGFRHQPLVPIALTFAVGIVLAERLPPRSVLPIGLLFTTACLIGAYFVRRREILPTALLLIAWFGLGVARWALQKAHSSDPRLQLVPPYTRLHLAGTVGSPAKPGAHSQSFVVQLHAMRDSTGWHAARGRVRVFAPDSFSVQIGDDVLFAGYIVRPLARRNPGAFNRLRYEQAHGVQALVLIRRDGWLVKLGQRSPALPLRKWTWMLQERLGERIDRLFYEKSVPLLRGVLLGLRSSIPRDTLEAFSRSGVIHILAVSGLHVGFVLLIFWGLAALLRLPRRPFSLFVLAGIWFYALLTGLKPPVIRAATMGSLFLVARLLDRPTRGENLLAAAGLLILIVRPGDLFLPGFQLSFAAVAGILYVFPKFKSMFLTVPLLKCGYRFRAVRYLLELTAVSLAAQLGTPAVCGGVFRPRVAGGAPE